MCDLYLYEMETANENMKRFFAHELPTVLPVMGPLLLRGLGQYSLNLVSMHFVNVHAPAHLAGVSLGMSLTTMLGWAAITGQSTALVTLTSQLHGSSSADGSPQKTEAYISVATFIHIMWTIVPILCLPIIYRFLLSLGQDVSVVNDAAWYLGLSILTLPPYAVFVTYRRYLDALLRPWPGALLCGSGVVLLSLFLPMMNSIGVPAQHTPPVSLFVLFLVFALILVGHVGPVHACGTIPSKRKLKRYSYIAFPAMLSMMSEWWSTEVLVVLAAQLGTASLTANAVCNTLLTFLYQISYAVSSSCSVRVGYWLGAGHPQRAKRSIIMHVLVSVVLAAMVATPLVAFREDVARCLVGRLDVATFDFTVQLIPFICTFFMLGAVQSCLYGGMCGAGMQHISLCCSIVAYWPIGVPVALYCGFTLGMGVVGFWYGLTVCHKVQEVVLIVSHTKGRNVYTSPLGWHLALVIVVAKAKNK